MSVVAAVSSVPFAGALLGDSHRPVMATAVQLLLALLSQPGSAPAVGEQHGGVDASQCMA